MGLIFIVNGDVPPLLYLLDIEVGRGGEDAITEDEGNKKGGESTATNIQTKVGYEGVNPPPPLQIYIDLVTIGSRPETKLKQPAPSRLPNGWEDALQHVKGAS